MFYNIGPRRWQIVEAEAESVQRWDRLELVAGGEMAPDISYLWQKVTEQKKSNIGFVSRAQFYKSFLHQ